MSLFVDIWQSIRDAKIEQGIRRSVSRDERPRNIIRCFLNNFES
jgi:hypothetical protein